MPTPLLTAALGDLICELIADGHALADIGRMPGMPSARAIRRWAVQDDGFAERYQRAAELGARAMADETLEIADEAQGYEDNAAVRAAALRIDARWRYLAKLFPGIYGDRLALDVKGEVRHVLSVRDFGDGRTVPAIEGRVVASVVTPALRSDGQAE